MSTKFTAGLADFLQARGSFKEALQDTVVNFYTGPQPSGPDVPATGTLVGVATLQSGALTPGAKSVRQVDECTVTYGTDGNVYALVVNGTSYSYTSVSGNDASAVAVALAALVDTSNVVSAVAHGTSVVTRARFGGNAVTLANTGTTTPGNLVITNKVANSRLNGLQWGASSGGVLSKESGSWSFVALASGTIGYARICASNDSNGSNTTAIRVDMNASTSNAPITLSNVNVTSGMTVTIDSATFTQPLQ